MTNNSKKPSRKAREEEFRRNLVLDVAEKLFAEKGFDGATVSEIAERSELAKGSFYHLFESKQDLIQAIVKRKIGLAEANIKGILAQPIKPLEKVLLILETKLRSIWDSREFARIFIHEFHGFNWVMKLPVLKEHKAVIMQLMKQVVELIAECQRDGDLRDDIPPEMIHASLEGISNALVHIWLRGDIEIDIDSAVKQAQTLFLNGVKPQKEGT